MKQHIQLSSFKFILVLGFFYAGLAVAQSISTGNLTKQEPRNFEKPFFGISFTSKSSGCSIAGTEADSFAKRNDARNVTLGNCDCSNAKRRLIGNLVGQYYTQTGKYYLGNEEVEVYECTVNARMTVIKTVLN